MSDGEIRLACIGIRTDSWGWASTLPSRVSQEDGLLYAEPLDSGGTVYRSRVNLKGDPFVAIPGGVTGWHAFFIILENVIRNAAKHGRWEKGTREPGCRPLDVVVEFLTEDNPLPPAIRIDRNGAVTRPAHLLRIYDNISVLPKERLKELNAALDTSIIENTGQLSRKNWGLAEMKIAAMFLQGRTLERLGPFDVNSDSITGLRPTNRDPHPTLADPSQGRAVIRAICSPLGTLGYEFYMLRPSRLGICALPGDTGTGQ